MREMMPQSSIGVRSFTGTSLTLRRNYRNPEGDYLAGSEMPNGGVPGSDVEALRMYLDDTGVERAMLCHGAGMLLPAHPSPRVAVELVRALNDWTSERWLAADERLHAAILVPTQTPDAAASEIRRAAANPRMVGVLMGANPLGKPFGHPIFEPIYKAAAELGLTVVIHSGGDNAVDSPAYPTAGGMPGSYSAFHVLSPHALMSHIVSLIGQGVPERYPSLKFLIVGGSVAWVIPHMWRFDTDFKAFRLDAPWLKDVPSAYFRKSFKVGTYPFDYAASAGQLATYFGVYPDAEEMMCYASGYPDWDSDTPARIQASLPTDWYEPVMRTNGLGFFPRASTSAQAARSSELPQSNLEG